MMLVRFQKIKWNKLKMKLTYIYPSLWYVAYKFVMRVFDFKFVHITIFFVKKVRIYQQHTHTPHPETPPPLTLSHPMVKSIIVAQLVTNINLAHLAVIHICQIESIKRYLYFSSFLLTKDIHYFSVPNYLICNSG